MFAARLAAAVGRPVSIDGGVDFVLLPRPAFNADEVRIGGAVSDDYVAVERLSARLAFLPLLEGRLQFRELILRRTEARVTRTAQGNVDFLGQPPVEAESPPGATASPPAPVDLDVDRVVIDDGTLVYQDIESGTALELRGVDATIVARPHLPATISGSFTVGKAPVELQAQLGQATAGGVRTLTAAVKLLEADASAKINATITPAGQHTEVRGDIALSGPSAAAVLDALGVRTAGSLPGALRKPFALAAKLRGSSADMTVDVASLDIGGTSAKGLVIWQSGRPSILDVKIEFGAVDLMAWRVAALEQAPTPIPELFPDLLKSAHAQEAAAPGTVPGLFHNVSVNVDIRMPILSYGDQTLRGGILKAGMAGNVLTIAEMSVELPGLTHVKTFGAVRFDESPVFEGAAEMQSGNVRAVLDWFGFDTTYIPPGRLSNASLRAAIRGTPAHFMLSDISATVDMSGMTGRLSWSAAPRPALGVDMTVTALNLDAYITQPEVRAAELAAAGASAGAKDGADAQEAKPAGYGVTPHFTSISGLADIDADVRVQIDNLTVGGVPGGKVGLDVGLRDNALSVRSASVDNVAGTTAWFSGGVSGFGISPRFDNVQFDFSATDIPRLARLLEGNAPAMLRGLAPVSFTGVLNGGFAEADIAATLKAAGMTLHADGKALTLDQQPHFTLNVDAVQPSYAALVKAAGLPCPVGTADPGAVKISARVTHDKMATRITDLTARVGENALAGDFDITEAAGQKTVRGTLKDVVFSVDRLWPRAPTMTLAPRSGSGRPVALLPTAGIWSEEPFNWSALNAWRGDVQVSGAALTVRGLQAQDFAFRLGIADGTAELTDWSGKVFGAPGQLYLKATALPSPSVQGEIAFLGGDLGAVAGAINGVSGSLKSGGKIDFAGSFRMQGASPAAFASDLSGSGSVKLSTTEAGTGPVSALLGAVAAAKQLEGLSGQKGGLVTLESRFSATAGRIRIEDATVASRSYGGAFTGIIDLPRWQVDMAGRLRLEAADAGGRPVSVPIAVKGALDLPNITLLPN